MKKVCMLAGILLPATVSHAQIIKRITERAKRKVEEKIDKKVDNTIDGAIDGKKNTGNKADSTATSVKNGAGEHGRVSGTASLTTYSKFDFIPGDKNIAIDDFSQDAIGDFPAKWNTNSTGELVTVEGHPGKWLSLSKDGAFLPEFIHSLPDNFTLEFELMCNEDFSFYSDAIYMVIAALKDPANDFTGWKRYGFGKRNGIQVGFHPTNAGNNVGDIQFTVFKDDKKTMDNRSNTRQFHAKTHNYVKVSVWRQKQRLRVYMNEEKVWDLPRALPATGKYNSILFMLGSFYNAKDRYLLSGIKLAVGAPDTRYKLITEGKFVTRGILFDVNSDVIKPESYGVLKDIATVLKENVTVRVTIVGHTDADGDDAANMELSKQRAAAVKEALVTEFGIDAGRLETDGKGESQPADTNDTPEGKANNRRVEFIKT